MTIHTWNYHLLAGRERFRSSRVKPCLLAGEGVSKRGWCPTMSWGQSGDWGQTSGSVLQWFSHETQVPPTFIAGSWGHPASPNPISWAWEVLTFFGAFVLSSASFLSISSRDTSLKNLFPTVASSPTLPLSWENNRALNGKVSGLVWVLSCPTLCDPMDSMARQTPLSLGFSGNEYWSGLPFSSSRGSSWPRVRTCVSCVGRWIFHHWATWGVHKCRVKTRIPGHFCKRATPPFCCALLYMSCLWLSPTVPVNHMMLFLRSLRTSSSRYFLQS